MREFKRWNFFRAEAPDELWQIDFRGPFGVQGKRWWFLVCIDNYSRFIVSVEQFDHELTKAETVAVLEKQKRLPKAIPSDHGVQFKDQWKSWCSLHGVEAHFAHPAYPQDKDKVERRALETQAILGLFDGEISIQEKETPKGTGRFLKVKRMSNQKYAKDETLL